MKTIRHWVRIRACSGHVTGPGEREVHVAASVPVTLTVGPVEFEIGELPAGTGTAQLPNLLRAVAAQMDGWS